MLRTGIVMKVRKGKADIISCSGEFVTVKIKNELPVVGQVYTGKVALKHGGVIALFCIAVAIFLTSNFLYNKIYSTPYSTITLHMNATIRLKVNKLNKVVAVEGVNRNAINILKKASVKNQAINDALINIVDEAASEKIIDNNFFNNNQIISVFISNDDGKTTNLNSFIAHVASMKIPDKNNALTPGLQINDNGTATADLKTKNN